MEIHLINIFNNFHDSNVSIQSVTYGVDYTYKVGISWGIVDVHPNASLTEQFYCKIKLQKH